MDNVICQTKRPATCWLFYCSLQQMFALQAVFIIGFRRPKKLSEYKKIVAGLITQVLISAQRILFRSIVSVFSK
jgi:hypothetical protein|uniref:Uncharacterized protein n=1 Tax=uncultured organism TaxID=155900 RepID=D8VN26_9ZZZZ|nr:hypothetical protein [uncultured organism]ACY24878.1 hypothetical protein [uncultured organism]